MKRFFGLIIMMFILVGCSAVRDAISGEEAYDAYEADETVEAPLRPVQPPAQTPALNALTPRATVDIELLGRWNFASGTFVFYFASHGDIEFFGDGNVKEYAFGEPGVFQIIDNGRMSVTGEWNPDAEFLFDYMISDDMLSITDRNGATGVWRRAGTNFSAAETADLLGQWEFVSGAEIWYFASHDDIRFSANGRVMEYAWGEPGTFSVVEPGRLRVVGEWNPDVVFYFDVEAAENFLAITDHDGNRAVWRRAAPEDAA
ncbi:MAG: hypothetical protein FWC70_12625 [Defluviitaleaceae bacterium]|nr:hypothetical protein [Defluviitaleaceae bacterium]